MNNTKKKQTKSYLTYFLLFSPNVLFQIVLKYSIFYYTSYRFSANIALVKSCTYQFNKLHL